MGESPFRGVKPPTSRHVHHYDVRGVPVGETWHVAILSYEILGLMCHWVTTPQRPKGNMELCMQPEPCQHCASKFPECWVGFLAAYLLPQTIQFVLRVGPRTAEKIGNLHVQHFGLRGLILQLTNDARAPNLAWRVEPSTKYKVNVPDAFDIEPTLRVLFRTPRLPTEIVMPAPLPLDEEGRVIDNPRKP